MGRHRIDAVGYDRSFLDLFIYGDECFACQCAPWVWKPEEDNVFPGVESTDNSEPLHVGAEH